MAGNKNRRGVRLQENSGADGYSDVQTRETASSMLPGTQPPSEALTLTERTIPRLSPLGRICFTDDVSIKYWGPYEWTAFVFLAILWTYGVGGLGGNINNAEVWFERKNLDDPQIHIHITYSLIGIQTIILIGVITGFIYLMSIRKLWSYGLVVVLLGIAGIALASLGFYTIIAICSQDLLDENMYKYIKSELPQVGFKNNVDIYQFKEKCCGVMSPDDWRDFGKKINLTRNSVPPSCCILGDSLAPPNSTCGLNVLAVNDTLDETKFFAKGCGPKLGMRFRMVFIRYLLEYLLGSVIITITIIMIYMVYRKDKAESIQEEEFEVQDMGAFTVPSTAGKSVISTATTGVFYAP